MKIGYFLSSEEWGPHDLIAQAVKAQGGRISTVCGSPTTTTRGTTRRDTAPFVWFDDRRDRAGGARGEGDDRGDVPHDPHPPGGHRPGGGDVGSAARRETSASASAAARRSTSTSSATHWPEADERLEMLAEAVRGHSDAVAGRGTGSIEAATTGSRMRASTTSRTPPPPIIVSGFGPQGDRASPEQDRRRVLHGWPRRRMRWKQFRSSGGEGKVQSQGGLKVCWDDDEVRARAYRHIACLANEGAFRASSPRSSRRPEHFEQASQLVTEDMLAQDTPCGPDIDGACRGDQERYEPGRLRRALCQPDWPRPGRLLRRLPRDEVLPRVG